MGYEGFFEAFTPEHHSLEAVSLWDMFCVRCTEQW